MEELILTLSYVLSICLERTSGYPMGMDIHRVWTWTQFFTHGSFHGQAKTVFMDMDMDLVLFNPIQTRPIAILISDGEIIKLHLPKRSANSMSTRLGL